MTPTVTPYPTPTPFPTPSGPAIIDMAPVANAIEGQQVATEVVAWWNMGIGPRWDTVSLFILIALVLGRFALFMRDFSRVSGD